MAKRVYVNVDKIEFRDGGDQVVMVLYKDGHVIEKLIASVESYPSLITHINSYMFFGTFDDYRKKTDEFKVS